MIQVKIIAFLIYSFFIQCSKSIDLILPLSDEDAPKFQVKKHFLSNELLAIEHVHYFLSYESLENDLIRRVVYYGLELINDTEDHPEDFTRYVLYGFSDDRSLVGVVKKQSGVARCEEIFGVSRDVISAFTQIPEVPETLIRNNDTSILGVFLSSIFNKTQSSNKRKYDDLDSVDDEAYLVRGNTDVSSKEIEKQVEVVIQNKSSTPTDQEVAGPSGITEHSNIGLKRKKDQISDESDSE